jgi:hypothetical protein
MQDIGDRESDTESECDGSVPPSPSSPPDYSGAASSSASKDGALEIFGNGVELHTPTTTDVSSTDSEKEPEQERYHVLALEKNVVITLPTQRLSLRVVDDPWISQDFNRRTKYSHIFYEGKAVVPENLFKFMSYEAYFSPRENCGYVSGSAAYCRTRGHHLIVMSIWRNKCTTRGIYLVLYDLIKKTITLEDKLATANLYMVHYAYTDEEWNDACEAYKKFAKVYISDPGFETDYQGTLLSTKHGSRKPDSFLAEKGTRTKRKPATPPPVARPRSRISGKSKDFYR